MGGGRLAEAGKEKAVDSKSRNSDNAHRPTGDGFFVFPGTPGITQGERR
jgi:hypothetical protein